MKTRVKNIITICVFILLGNQMVSQTYKNDKTTEEMAMESQQVTSAQYLANLGIDNSPNPRNASIVGNAVSVRQIGEFNQTAIRTRTNASEISLLQNGNGNFTGLNYTANTAVADLVQNGDLNVIKDYVYDPTEDVSLQLTQDGDNIYFERFGTNEITKSLKFKQTEAAPTIIVRSFQ